jgi:hypothetical protein
MLSQLELFVILYFKYLTFYLTLYFLGRAFVIILFYFYDKKLHLPNRILNIKAEYVYPFIGLIFLGNLLIVLNYLIPLKNIITYVVITVFLCFNLLKVKKFNFEFYKLQNIFIYVVIPSILIISTIDITFHYDAGYYHLNHQNWLRESNMVIGMVNIFWAFGMSSIYEYISAILWFDSSFVLLHMLSLYFIHFLYIFLITKAVDRSSKLKYVALFVLIFSILDNFGISGGRNGYIYIQEIGKQDTSVAILFFVISFIIVEFLIEKKIRSSDMVLLSLMSFFIFQIKLSGVFIYLLFSVLVVTLFINNNKTYKDLFTIFIPNLFFALIWFTKSYLTTGCVVFPVSFTCKNLFSWYLPNSTIAYQEISTDASFSYIQYFIDDEQNFLSWFNDFFQSDQYASFSAYYKSYYGNFLISIIIIFTLKKVFFKTSKNFKKEILILYSFILLNIVYLIFFGPIPRYSMGILTVFIGALGLNVMKEKIKLKPIVIYTLAFVSIFSLVRLGSYTKLLETSDLAIDNPQESSKHYEEVPINNNWIKPSSGDRCWINIKCTMHIEEITLNSGNFYTTASR